MKRIFYIACSTALCLSAMFWFGCKKEASEPYVLTVGNETIMVQRKDLGSGDYKTASVMCHSSNVGGFTDWRLPTEQELMALYVNRSLIGGFGWGRRYWARSSYRYDDVSDYSYVNFRDGSLKDDLLSYRDSDMICSVRAVRTVTK